MCQVKTDYAFQHSKRVLRQQRAERYEGAADLRLWKRAASAAYRAYAVVTPPPLLGGGVQYLSMEEAPVLINNHLMRM